MKLDFIKIVLVLFLGISGSCQFAEPPDIAFYHWKTTFKTSQAQETYLKNLRTPKIYLRFFDVDTNPETNEASPEADVQLVTKPLQEVVPTIFITNRCLANLPISKIEDLAQKIINRIQKKALQEKITLKEIQLDCDWTAQTQQKYFYLCGIIKKNILPKNILLSATIRLHQLKYVAQTGVPPVDKGVLMFYNMGNLMSYETENSILDLKESEKYLAEAPKYPLELDLALPLFSWAVVLRNEKVVHLISDIEKAEFNDEKYLKKIKKDYFSITKSHYFKGVYLYENDVLRIEKTTLKDLETSVDLLKTTIQKPNTIIFYHLSEPILNEFTYENLQNLVRRWR